MTLAEIAPAIAALAALGVFVLTLIRDRHPLAAIERMKALKQDVQSAAIGSMTSDYYDELVAKWVLSRRAPHFPAWLTCSRYFYIVCALSTTAMLIEYVFKPPEFSFVSKIPLYATIVLSFFLGRVASVVRRRLQNEWIEQELKWRGIVLNRPSSYVKSVKNETASRVLEYLALKSEDRKTSQ